jgi:phosphoribosylamine--glycine ligase
MDTVSVGVVMSIPDYPYSRITRKEVCGIPIYLSNARLMKSISLCEASMGMAPMQVHEKILTVPCLVTAGDYVLVAVGQGKSVQAARKTAYRVLDQIEIPNNPMYRTDIGLRLAKQLPLIQKHGFAKGMEF